jgi:phosphoadenosine phosphosulfate reductase
MHNPTHLQDINAQLESASPQEVLRWAVDTYGDKLAVVTSFQPTGLVILQLLSEIAPNTQVLTLDTGLLFPETYAHMDAIEQRLNLKLRRVRPELTVAEQENVHGAALWQLNPDACCNMRKVVPLQSALNGYDAWITGLRRDQSDGRAHTPVVSWDERNQRAKISPLATWTEAMVWTFIEAYEIPYNPLHDQGYPTIGCVPCTQAVEDSSDLRGGRWVGRGKKECGIHSQ